MNSLFPERLREIWNGLNTREKRLIAGGGVLLALVFLYVLLWLPLQKDLARLRVNVTQDRTRLEHMRALAETVRPLRAKIRTRSAGGAPLSIVDAMLTAQNLRSYVSHLEADGANSVRLSLDGVPFNMLITLLTELQDTQQLVVDSATLDAQAKPGLVNANLRLRSDTP
jgi:general secretion pathway protein M